MYYLNTQVITIARWRMQKHPWSPNTLSMQMRPLGREMSTTEHHTQLYSRPSVSAWSYRVGQREWLLNCCPRLGFTTLPPHVSSRNLANDEDTYISFHSASSDTRLGKPSRPWMKALTVRAAARASYQHDIGPITVSYP